MQHYPEDHHKKPEHATLSVEAELSKNETQLLQKQLDMDLETLNEQIQAFAANPDSTQLDRAIIEEQLTRLHNLISYDETFHPHIQDQIERLRSYEARFDTLKH